jgi:hypothetical protein
MTHQKGYAEIQAVNFSTLKNMNVSPAHYRYWVDRAVPETDAMTIGSAVHVAVLEPDKFPLRFMVWEGGVRRGKEWEMFKVAAGDRGILKPDEYQTCLDIRDAVRGHERAGELLVSGISELTIQWTDETTGMACKGRIDYLNAANVLIDLKTTRDAGGAFLNQAARMLYHVQMAWYRDALRACKRSVAETKFIAVENKPPYDVMVYDIPDAVLKQGRDRYQGWMLKLQECRLADKWPGRCPDWEVPFVLPEWASGEDDITGMDLDF